MKNLEVIEIIFEDATTGITTPQDLIAEMRLFEFLSNEEIVEIYEDYYDHFLPYLIQEVEDITGAGTSGKQGFYKMSPAEMSRLRAMQSQGAKKEPPKPNKYAVMDLNDPKIKAAMQKIVKDKEVQVAAQLYQEKKLKRKELYRKIWNVSKVVLKGLGVGAFFMAKVVWAIVKFIVKAGVSFFTGMRSSSWEYHAGTDKEVSARMKKQEDKKRREEEEAHRRAVYGYVSQQSASRQRTGKAGYSGESFEDTKDLIMEHLIIAGI